MKIFAAENNVVCFELQFIVTVTMVMFFILRG